MAAGFRLLVDISGQDLSDAATICPSYCSKYKVGTCTEPCISFCESICGAYSPAPAPSPSEIDFIPTTLPVPNVKHMLFVTISVSALAAAFVFFTFLAIRRFCNIWYNRRRQRRRESREERFDPDQFVDQDLGPIVDHPIWHIRTVGLQPSIISKIAVVRYKKGGALIQGTDCAVCLSEFQDGESLRILPKCNHPFHLPCIDTWLRSHTNCPICRAGIAENPTRFPSGDRSGQTSDEDEINRESEMADTDNNSIENNSVLRIEIHDSNESVTGEKMDDVSRYVGRSVSMGSRIGNADQNPVAGMSERWVLKTGAPSSSSPASSSSVQRSASCNAKVFPPR